MFNYHARGADFRHTTLSSTQATCKYGKAAPYGAAPILHVCSFSEVIKSLLSNMSAFLSDCRCKYTKRFREKLGLN